MLTDGTGENGAHKSVSQLFTFTFTIFMSTMFLTIMLIVMSECNLMLLIRKKYLGLIS